VTNPFYEVIPAQAQLGARTVNRAQLLAIFWHSGFLAVRGLVHLSRLPGKGAKAVRAGLQFPVLPYRRQAD
jgi:hypothetical protein